MKIAIIGTGYVGLVVGTGLAESGHFVTCVDKAAPGIEKLQKGQLPIYEPGLEELVMRNVEEERLSFTTDVAEAVPGKLLVFLCVGTPQQSDGSADMSFVYQAAEEVGRALTGYAIIVSKSTCPVGTCERIREIVGSVTRHPFDVVSNPEFLKEGNAVDDFMRPDRVVVGCDDVRVLEIMRELYSPFLRTGKPFIAMDIRSAEMSKYAVNTMLAARISLVNELANVSAALGADISKVREVVMSDSRIGASYLFPGLGFGGSCLPKDVLAAVNMAKSRQIPCPVLEGIAATNQWQRRHFVERILEHYGEAIPNKRIALWGVSFKPRTDDVREAPAIYIIERLLDAGAEVVVYDPVSGPKVHATFSNRAAVMNKMYSCLEDADGLVIATEWREFHQPDFERMAKLMRERVIFDGRNLYTPKTLAEYGFRYFSIGRPDT
jgi:UDPglucose 6-dehydrogenase